MSGLRITSRGWAALVITVCLIVAAVAALILFNTAPVPDVDFHH